MDMNWGHAVCMLVYMLLLYLVFHLIKKRRKDFWQNLGFMRRNAVKMSFFGFFAGVVFCLVYVIPLYLTNQIHIEFMPFSISAVNALSAGFLIYTGISFAEEITFRGYIQHSISEKNKNWSIAATAVLFAANHLLNSSYTPITLVYLFIAGMAFSLMRVVTKGLWFPMGFHLAYDWFEITLLGFENENPAKRWFFTTVTRETVWTGENGVSGLAVILTLLILTAILFYMKTKHRNTSK
jgi:membrane protease YdiL (CAAX protease family)